MDDAENSLMRTIDLPEGKGAMVDVALDTALNDAQTGFITKY